jgi:NitT/TauT family transport system permease protein
MGGLAIALTFAVWWFVTRGEAVEERILPTIPSPGETFGDFASLWFDAALTRNLAVTLRRVVLGFMLAAVVGVPLGVLCGCFRSASAFFAPLALVGRNIPIAALIPLTFSLFGIGEFQKVMFIFLACVAFVITDAARAVADIRSQYVDTAYTLGASRWQVVMKVLVPLAMPGIFNSLRLLFGLAFGYIMLAEVITIGGEAGGLGNIINVSQRRSDWPRIYLILLIIPLVALTIDQILYWIQRQLFPHLYGSAGILRSTWSALLHFWEDVKLAVLGGARPRDASSRAQPQPQAAPEKPAAEKSTPSGETGAKP